jgi:hypothetical protein
MSARNGTGATWIFTSRLSLKNVRILLGAMWAIPCLSSRLPASRFESVLQYGPRGGQEDTQVEPKRVADLPPRPRHPTEKVLSLSNLLEFIHEQTAPRLARGPGEFAESKPGDIGGIISVTVRKDRHRNG